MKKIFVVGAIKRPYKVYYGEREYSLNYEDSLTETLVDWTHDKSFHLESDADAYAERLAEDYEFVKIEKKQ